MQRHRFDVVTDTGGDFVDTGPPIEGVIMQAYFGLSTFDTGTSIKLEMINSGVVVADYDNIGGSNRTVGPRLITYDTGGDVLGDTPFVAAHDRLRLTVNQGAGDTGVKSGTVYLWTA